MSLLLEFIFSAPAADPAQLDPEILDLEVEAGGIRDRESIEAGIGDIDDGIATKTDEMVVHVDVAVVPCCAARVAGLGDEPQPGKALEGAIDGGPRNVGVLSGNGRVNLVCGGVVVKSEDGFEDGPFLDGVSQALFPAYPAIGLDASGFQGFVQQESPSLSIAK
jgi:hypothetical protein